MMNKNIKITIAGQVDYGKSTIVDLIKRFLRKEGFNVTFDPRPDFTAEVYFDMEMDKNRGLRTNAVKQQVKISLEEKQLCLKAIEK